MRRFGDDISAPLELRVDPWPSEFSVENVIDALSPLVTPSRKARLHEVIRRRLGTVTLLMDRIRDPYNGAALLRTCEAFGIQNVHIIEEERFLISGRVTQGAHHWLDLHRYGTADAAIGAIHRGGYEPILAHPSGCLEPEDLASIPRLCLVLGNEHEGVQDALARHCARSVRVPMCGFAESLNVSVTGGILVCHAARGRMGDLQESDQRLLLARGLYRTVSRARDVLIATHHSRSAHPSRPVDQENASVSKSDSFR